MKFCLIVVLTVFGLTSSCFSEIYKDFMPYDTLKEIKARYPNATFTQISPAWAKEKDVMYALEGTGMPGKVVLMLIDDHEFFQELCSTRDSGEKNAFCESKLSDPEHMIWLNSTRWIPRDKIPLKKLIEKYGKPTFKTDEDFNSYAEWKKRNIGALLTDDKKFAKHINFDFTTDEFKKALKDKYVQRQ